MFKWQCTVNEFVAINSSAKTTLGKPVGVMDQMIFEFTNFQPLYLTVSDCMTLTNPFELGNKGVFPCESLKQAYAISLGLFLEEWLGC